MNSMDPKWLEILKASGWQTAALALAFGTFIILVKTKIIPVTDSPLWIDFPTLSFLICGFLTLANTGSAANKTFKPGMMIRRWRDRRRHAEDVRKYISHMTEKDRQIIGYLLHYNQKVFDADQDGGYAAPLISKRVIRCALIPGQAFDVIRVPFEIPDHVWSVLKENRESFPYTPPVNDEDEVYPWAIDWRLR